MNPFNFEVRRTASRRALDDAVLVLRSLGIAHRLDTDRGDHVLLVAPGDANRALAELREYEREDLDTPVAAVPPRRTSGWAGALTYVAVLFAVFALERHPDIQMDLRAGVASSTRILEGEWWRAFTALTLHADVGHVAGNAAFGAVFGGILAQALGSGVAWWTIFLTGGLGNLLNAWLHGPGHNSVGASTAVFGTLGVMAAWQWCLNRKARLSRMRLWAPFIGAIILLTYLGTGGERTDVLAHVTGFGAGIGLGLAHARWVEPHTPGRWGQTSLGLLLLVAIAALWSQALR